MIAAKCAGCHGHHETLSEYKTCQTGGAVKSSAPAPPPMAPHVPAWRLKWVTAPQRTMVANLGGSVDHTHGMNRGQCSDYINELKAGQATVTANPYSAPNRTTTIIPMDFLTSVPDGYYASRPDSNHEFTFFRVSRPKLTSKSRYAGALKIQTQHGPELKLFMVVWPSGSLTVYNKVPEDDFLLVCVDPNGTGLAYAMKIGHCCLCGTELTDPRSRWYGVGPDCEKKKPRAQVIIRTVEETKGVFRYGADS